MLQHEAEALDKLKWYSIGARLTFNYTGSIGKSFEYTILEHPFTFWQFGIPCDSIPTNKSLDTYLTHFLKFTGDLSSFSDQTIKFFQEHYYQAVTENGYYGYNIIPLKKYINYFTENPSGAFPPKTAPVKPFDTGFTKKVENWLQEKGNNIIYIYGAIDTWSAARPSISNKVNSKCF